MTSPKKFIYVFGTSRTEGAANMKNLLGGKGANLAEMCRLSIGVRSGFTISTEACTEFTAHGRDAVFNMILSEGQQGVALVGSEMGKRVGDSNDSFVI